MGRTKILVVIWLIGFILGFLGFYIYPSLGQITIDAFPSLASIDPTIQMAAVTGLMTSAFSIIAVVIWARVTD